MSVLHWGLLLLAALPVIVQAGSVIAPDSGDSPLVISGWLEEGSGFTGNLRLTAQPEPGEGDDNDVSFLLLASDLKSADGTQVIGRQNVALVGNPVLQPGVPKDFQLTVTGISEPATYQGQLELLPSDRARSEALVIELTVNARARPNLKPLPSAESLRLDLVNCANRLSCGLAGLLLPDSAFLNHWELQFNNASAAEAALITSAVGVLGDKTRYPLDSGQLALPEGSRTFPARQIGTVPLTLNRAAMPPDHYTGNLYLSLDGAQTMHEVPVDLSVRVGPLWPLLAILFGIIIGRLTKYMQERGGPQTDKLAAVNRVELALRDAPQADKVILEPQLAAVRKNVYRHQLDTVTTELEAIEARLEVLGKLRDMEKGLAGKEQDHDAKIAQEKIITARQKIAARQDEEASALIAEAEQNLDALNQTLMGGGASAATLTQAVQAAGAAKAAADKARNAAGRSVAAESEAWPRVKSALIGLSGLSAELRAEATLWIVRPLLYFVLLFGLLAVGLETLYVTNGLTFGANPFPDYLGLILWGLSADVAGRTLTNLQGTKAAGQS